MSQKPIIYIAGPISNGWLPDNIRAALRAADAVYACGAIPFVPHTHGTLWELMVPRPYQFWMEIGMALLERCNGLVRVLPNEPSGGSDRERALAHHLGLPVWISEVGMVDAHDIVLAPQFADFIAATQRNVTEGLQICPRSEDQ